MVSPWTASSSERAIFGRVWLNRRAPCEPPKTRSRGGPGGGEVMEKNSGRTGIPVISALRNHLDAAGEVTAAACPRLPMRRVGGAGEGVGAEAKGGNFLFP